MRNFEIWDLAPLCTKARAKGEIVFICGRQTPVLLDHVKARNAADALALARQEWPSMPLEQMEAREVKP